MREPLLNSEQGGVPTQANTLRQSLQEALALGVDRLDAQMLLLHALGRDPHGRGWLMAHDTDVHSALTLAAFHDGVQRRLQGEPVAYITGSKEIFGLDLQVDPRVLVPRPDTETLVQWALDVLVGRNNARAIDLGTGSGAIALALKHHLPGLQMDALDFSEAALQLAKRNAEHLQLAISFTQGSWLENVTGPYDLIVSNPPYIEANDPHLAALTFEPTHALTSGIDGLDDIRIIVGQAPNRIKPDGWLLLEHGYNQSEVVRALLINAGFTSVQSRTDLAGVERCSGGCWRLGA